LVAPCALDANAEVLARIDKLLDGTQRRVLNQPQGIVKSTREAAYELLGKAGPEHQIGRNFRT
jgi:hypothetical protein